MHVLGFVTLLSLLHVCLGQLPVCYYSAGAKATGSGPNDIPCDPDASNSICCGQGYICETSLYCLNQQGLTVLGSCTDPTWQSVDCPLAGIGEVFNFDSVTNCSGGTYCPNSNNQSCCEANQGHVMISYSNTATIPDDLSDYYGNAGYSIPVTASAHSSSASSSLPMTITGATSASAAPTSIRQAITTTASPTSSILKTSTSASQASSSSSSGVSKGASAGAGVGAALGVLIIGAGVIFFIYKRKRKNGVVEGTPSGMMMERA